MNIVVTSITALNAGSEICICVEMHENENFDKIKLTLLMNQYVDLKISKGEISRERFDEISYAASICSAYKKGLFLLGYGACSEKTLICKLRTKGFEDHISREAVAMLSSEGYIKEDDDSVREAERCIAKLWGRKRIISHLYSKGYSQDSVKYATEHLDDVDFVNNCVTLISRNYKKQFEAAKKDPTQRAKLVSALARMGYSFSEIKEASATYAADRTENC